MRAKPDMKPWVNTYKTKKSSDEERHFRREYLSLGVPPLKGLKKCIDYYYPGLAPWAVKKYRPYGALRRLPPINILYSFDALALALPPPLQNTIKIIIFAI